jgi:hypothetical protein
VFLELIDDDLAGLEYRSGAVRILDVDGLVRAFGLQVADVNGHPDAFTEDGVLIAPWPVAERVAVAAARRECERVLRHVAREEREAQHQAVYGEHYTSGRGKSLERHFIEPEWSIEYDEQYGRPVRKVLRSWCGVEAVERFDELAELRKEVRRVGEVAQAAIEALRATGHEAQAARLERELGTPVEMLRVDNGAEAG